MRRYFGLPKDGVTQTAPAVTLGMFDGVHRGHRAVLEATQAAARAAGSEAVVLTFDTHPRRVVAPSTPLPMITSLQHRLDLFERLGMDAAVILPFGPGLAQRSASSFLEDILLGQLGLHTIVLGSDAHFGQGREGNIAYLQRAGEARGFAAQAVPEVCLQDGTVISSSAIREAVLAAAFDRAAEMLGRPVSVLGTVASGLGLGRQLGFPTLNLDPHHELHPPRGVYITRTCIGQTCWRSVTNVGHRPTVDAVNREDVLIETHVLESSIGELYGQVVEVLFEARLRDEKHFPNPQALQAAIADDVAAAQAWFEAR